MRMLTAVIICVALSAFAAAPPRGADRLRDLIIFPEINLNLEVAIQYQGNQWKMSDDLDVSDEISDLQNRLKGEPENARDLLDLGLLLFANGDSNASQMCFQRAMKLCRDKVAANPNDVMALDDLGAVLFTLGRDKEAESVYRKAAVVSPRNWRCLVDLGNFLALDSFLLMFPENLRGRLTVGAEPPRAILDYRPSQEALGKAEDSLKESSRCFDTAIAIAPREPALYLQRAGYMITSNWENCFFGCYRGNAKLDSVEWTMVEFSGETIENLEHAAELSPGNCDYIGLAAGLKWMAAAARANSSHFTPNMLSETDRRSIDDAIARLENLSQNPDQHVASKALEYLGFLYFSFGNSQAAASQLRRAVAVDPAREHCWDMLIATSMKDTDFPDEAVSICKSRLQYKNSEKNHLFLAKAYTYKKEWSLAAGEAEIAAGLDTNNVLAPLMLAAVDLKQSTDARLLPKSKEELDQAYLLLGRIGSSPDSWQRWREINLNGAIFYGLQETSDDEKNAKTCIDQVLKYFPNDPTAKAILQALPGTVPSNEAQDD